MIDFAIPGETAALRDEIRAFVTEEVVPFETDPRLTRHGQSRICAPSWWNWRARPGC
jgi:hypothetical protein